MREKLSTTKDGCSDSDGEGELLGDTLPLSEDVCEGVRVSVCEGVRVGERVSDGDCVAVAVCDCAPAPDKKRKRRVRV